MTGYALEHGLEIQGTAAAAPSPTGMAGMVRIRMRVAVPAGKSGPPCAPGGSR